MEVEIRYLLGRGLSGHDVLDIITIDDIDTYQLKTAMRTTSVFD
jgi:hypothetical protein